MAIGAIGAANDLVELDEGVKMLTNLVDCAPEQARIGMPVEVVYEDVTPQVTLAKFRPAR